jgi:hypothetical protein
MKLRKVSFDLTLPRSDNKLAIDLMLTRGYSKKDILECFEHLQSCGFGFFNRGKQGRGHIAFFVPNCKCPPNINLSFQVQQKAKDYTIGI